MAGLGHSGSIEPEVDGASIGRCVGLTCISADDADDSSTTQQHDSELLGIQARERHCPDIADLPDPMQPTFAELFGEGKYFNCPSVPRSTCSDRTASVEGDMLDIDTSHENDYMPHLSDSTTPTPLDTNITQKPQLFVK
ncbi:hypothetical protein MRX96_030518 [Rhipicephalus microplus]